MTVGTKNQLRNFQIGLQRPKSCPFSADLDLHYPQGHTEQFLTAGKSLGSSRQGHNSHGTPERRGEGNAASPPEASLALGNTVKSEHLSVLGIRPWRETHRDTVTHET